MEASFVSLVQFKDCTIVHSIYGSGTNFHPLFQFFSRQLVLWIDVTEQCSYDHLPTKQMYHVLMDICNSVLKDNVLKIDC
jgi:hypothetical protein